MSLPFRPWIPRTAAVFGVNLLLPASALAAPATGAGAVPALYATQAEAEKAARLHFNCTGAHRMGNQWMPCAEHSDVHGASPSH